jgi:hypothetical protein
MIERLVVLAFVVFGAFVACTPAEEAPPSGSSSSPQSGESAIHVVDPEARCANESDVVADQSLRTDSTLSGDVDGDGLDDEISVASDESAPTGCTSFLVVVTEERTYSAPIETTDLASSLQVPSLNSLAEVGGKPGQEIVVNVEAGASTQFVGLFTLTGDGLERMTMQGEGPFSSHGELFAFGGSVGHLEAVTCISSDIVIMSAAVPKGARATDYEVERRFFLVEGTTLKLDRGSIEHHSIDGLTVDRFPEFASSPFVGCD